MASAAAASAAGTLLDIRLKASPYRRREPTSPGPAHALTTAVATIAAASPRPATRLAATAARATATPRLTSRRTPAPTAASWRWRHARAALTAAQVTATWIATQATADRWWSVSARWSA